MAWQSRFHGVCLAEPDSLHAYSAMPLGGGDYISTRPSRTASRTSVVTPLTFSLAMMRLR